MVPGYTTDLCYYLYHPLNLKKLKFCKYLRHDIENMYPADWPLYFSFIDGDLGHNSNVVDAYMKQKHRLIWERRKQAAESQE